MEVKPSKGYQYLLVMVYMYSGWVEAIPTRTEWAQEVTKTLLREIRGAMVIMSPHSMKTNDINCFAVICTSDCSNTE